MADLTLLTPHARPKPRLPLWALVVVGIGIPATIALRRWIWTLPTTEAGLISFDSSTLGTLPLSIAGCFLTAWLEARLYLAFWPMPSRRRVSLTLALPLGGLAVALIFCLALLLVADHVAWAALFIPPIAISGYWFSAAGVGSAITVVVDVVVSAIARGFRSRVLLAMGTLLTITSIGSACLAFWSAWFSTTVHASVDPQGHPPSRATVQMIAMMHAHPLRYDAAIFAAISLLFIPIAFSAVGKLAEGVMERLHPLALGFDALAQGRRDVRVEEAGSAEFTQLATRFNRMVEGLALAEQMEHAFGMYVSGQLMKRIRDQHGQALLPATLREASVLFADIRGFTQMSERMSPEAIVGLLNRYFDRVVAVVNEHEGYLNKFVGDAVVVVFNGPVDQADHPIRAVKCAIALQQAVDALNREGAFPELSEGLRVGIGIATGPMVCGNVGGKGHVEYTVIGDTVNLASRLTSSARPGEVWLNSVAAVQLPAELAAQPLEPIRVKGKAEPVLPFLVWPQGERAAGRAMASASD
jgi:class 3 adenylate cyclase